MKRRKRTRFLLLVFFLTAALAAALLFQRFRRPAGPELQLVEAPPGTQLLYFPIEKGLITAGYQNRNYLEKFGYPHYGIDVTAAKVGKAEVLAAGRGVVLGTERCENSLGYIAVIRHDDVYLPETGETLSLIGRYYHMITMEIGEGDVVEAGQAIGSIDTVHEWYNHIHLELDVDLDYPFHTPQVAEASSGLLHRYPADGDGILEPISLLAVGKGQGISVHPYSKSCTEKDWPRYGGA